MNELILVVIGIIVYAEIFPTISAMFEYIRTILGFKISRINLEIAKIQAEVNKLAVETEDAGQTHAVGFQLYDNEYEDGEE